MDPLIPLFVKNEQDESFDLERESYQLAEVVGWNNLLKEVFLVLARPVRRDFWHQAASVLYWAVSDHIPLPFPFEECAARLYRSLELHPGLGRVGLDDGENLVWSILAKMKGVPYESRWNPLDEPKVAQRLQQLQEDG